MSYASLAQARAEGVTTQQAGDTRLQVLLDNASRYIDTVTGLFFEPRTRTLRFSGNGEIWLALPAPVITLTGVTLDDGALAWELDRATPHAGLYGAARLYRGWCVGVPSNSAVDPGEAA